MSGMTILKMMCAASTASSTSIPSANHVSDLFISASELANKVKALEASLTTLDASFDRIERWLLAFTAVVVIGLIVEYWDDIREFRHALSAKRSGLSLSLNFDPVWHPAKAVIGGVLVVAGVAGELVEEYNAASVEVSQRIVSGKVDAILELEAANATDDAANANAKTADLASQFGGLKNLVDTTEQGIKAEESNFQKRAAADEAANRAIIADLNSRKAELLKARSDALAAADSAQKVLDKIDDKLAELKGLESRVDELSATTIHTVQVADTALKRALPRSMDMGDCAEELRHRPQAPVEIFVIKGAADGNQLAEEMGDCFMHAGWPVPPVKPIPDAASVGANEFGITLDGGGNIFRPIEDTARMAVFRMLQGSGASLGAIRIGGGTLPNGTIRIVIAPKA